LNTLYNVARFVWGVVGLYGLFPVFLLSFPVIGMVDNLDMPNITSVYYEWIIARGE